MDHARKPKMFTLREDVIAALEQRSKETDEPMSRIVERGLRLALALPVEPRGEGEGALGSTRAETTTLEVLRSMGGALTWFATPEINDAMKGGFAVTERALAALGRRGEVFQWGKGGVFAPGETEGPRFGRFDTWSLSKPLDLVARVLARRPDGNVGGQVLTLIGKLAVGMTEADANAAREMVIAKSPSMTQAILQHGYGGKPGGYGMIITQDAIDKRDRDQDATEKAAFEAEHAAQQLEYARVNAENAAKMAAYRPEGGPVVEQPHDPIND